MNDLYPIRVYPIEEVNGIDWIAEYPDLPGCIGVGDSREDAIQEGEANKEMWLEAARNAGDTIPEPSSFHVEDFSGRFNLRLPKSLHRDLSNLADLEDVSLNTMCVKLLAESISGKFCLEAILEKRDLIQQFETDNRWKIAGRSGSKMIAIQMPAG